MTVYIDLVIKKYYSYHKQSISPIIVKNKIAIKLLLKCLYFLLKNFRRAFSGHVGDLNFNNFLRQAQPWCACLGREGREGGREGGKGVGGFIKFGSPTFKTTSWGLRKQKKWRIYIVIFMKCSKHVSLLLYQDIKVCSDGNKMKLI